MAQITILTLKKEVDDLLRYLIFTVSTWMIYIEYVMLSFGEEVPCYVGLQHSVTAEKPTVCITEPVYCA